MEYGPLGAGATGRKEMGRMEFEAAAKVCEEAAVYTRENNPEARDRIETLEEAASYLRWIAEEIQESQERQAGAECQRAGG